MDMMMSGHQNILSQAECITHELRTQRFDTSDANGFFGSAAAAITCSSRRGDSRDAPNRHTTATAVACLVHMATKRLAITQFTNTPPSPNTGWHTATQ